MRFHRFTWTAVGLAALLAVGCACSDNRDTEAKGTARVGLITPQAYRFELTRVSVETDTGFSADLIRDPNTSVFTGSLVLPVGLHEITGRAFVEHDLVGVSSRVPVDIQAGALTQVTIQILDTTGGPQPDFGPLLEHLSHPQSTTAGTEVMFAASIIDLDGTPVTMDWSDDCTDSTFTAPLSATTGWSKATPGSCNVTVTGSSNGLSVSQSFSIAVLTIGGDDGAADIITEFISAPSSEVQLTMGDLFCYVNQYSFDASCSIPVASPTVPSIYMFTDWLNGTPGTLTLSDDCGGTFGVNNHFESFINANWLPPVQGGVCRITARAVNLEGVVSEISMAISVRPGTPRQPEGVPHIQVDLQGPQTYCNGSSDQGEALCDPTPAGSVMDLYGSIFWDDTFPGSIESVDSCGGSFLGGYEDLLNGYFDRQWQAPAEPATDCSITVIVTSLEGISRSAVFRFDVN